MRLSHGIGAAILEMVRFFLPRCSDRSTLEELERMAGDQDTWRQAHALFGRIRDKTLKADDAGDRLLQVQYSFEEICAKTLYNVSGANRFPFNEFPPPFDADAAFWVFPRALAFARALGIEEPLRVSSWLAPRLN